MNSPSPVRPRPDRARIRAGEISILLATRGRPDLLTESFESLKATTAQKDKTVLWVYVDEDDQPTREAIAANRLPDPGFPIHWHVGPRTPGLGETHQAMWNASGRASEVYMISSDKARFATPHWDEVIRAKFAEYPDGVLLAYAHDPNTADQATYPILGWGWLGALGYFFPGHFPFWFDDKWVDEIGRMAGRYVKLDLVIAPIRGRGRTQRMRGMPFWVRFFQLTLRERKDAARRLLEAAYPQEGPDRAAAFRQMEALATELAKQEDAYSDLYATFQEERHTAVSQEDRDRFDPLYFTQETRALTRLLQYAQEHLTRGEADEALKYLDAAALSEVRVRTAQLMKADCLRALGRAAEADACSKEALAVWPQASLARRLFRFLGMFANEAKRLLVSASSKEEKPGKQPAG